MSNYNAFQTTDLSTALALLNVIEASGITDVRFVRTSIQREIDSRFMNSRAVMSSEQREIAREQKTHNRERFRQQREHIATGSKCPSCSIGVLTERFRQGVRYNVCVRRNTGSGITCGYSKMIEYVGK